MDHTVVRPEATNQGWNSLPRSFNDLNFGKELHPLKPSLTSPSENGKEHCVSFASNTPPKISSEYGKGKTNSVPVRLSSGLTRLSKSKETKITTKIGDSRMKTSRPRPRSCTARVPSTTSSSLSSHRTPESLKRNRLPRPSLPVEIADKLHSTPSSPTLTRTSYTKTLSFTSSQSVVEETSLVDFRRKSADVGLVSCSTPPMSPGLLRKFKDSDKTVRKARTLIDDFKRSGQIQSNKQRVEGKSLAEAMEEVKNCRYLRVVKRKDELK